MPAIEPEPQQEHGKKSGSSLPEHRKKRDSSFQFSHVDGSASWKPYRILAGNLLGSTLIFTQCARQSEESLSGTAQRDGLAAQLRGMPRRRLHGMHGLISVYGPT